MISIVVHTTRQMFNGKPADAMNIIVAAYMMSQQADEVIDQARISAHIRFDTECEVVLETDRIATRNILYQQSARDVPSPGTDVLIVEIRTHHRQYDAAIVQREIALAVQALALRCCNQAGATAITEVVIATRRGIRFAETLQWNCLSSS